MRGLVPELAATDKLGIKQVENIKTRVANKADKNFFTVVYLRKEHGKAVKQVYQKVLAL